MSKKIKGPKIDWARVMSLADVISEAASSMDASANEMTLAHGQALMRATLEWQEQAKP